MAQQNSLQPGQNQQGSSNPQQATVQTNAQTQQLSQNTQQNNQNLTSQNQQQSSNQQSSNQQSSNLFQPGSKTLFPQSGNTSSQTGSSGVGSGGGSGSGGVLNLNKPTENKPSSLFPNPTANTASSANTTANNTVTNSNTTTTNLASNLKTANPSTNTGQGQGILGQSQTQSSSIGSKNQIAPNKSLEELFKEWKKDLDEQTKNFEKLASSLIDHEKEAVDNYSNGENLRVIIKTMWRDYEGIKNTLELIDHGQNELLGRLDGVEKELSNYLHPSQSNQENRSSRTELINNAQKLNKDIFEIEKELINLVQEMNQPENSEESSQITEVILNNYFDAIQSLDSETLVATDKLRQIENLLSSRQFLE